MSRRRFRRVNVAKLTRISILPSLFTILNLFLGYLALFQIISRQHFRTAIIYLVAAAIMDGFDGTIARLTHTESNFGMQLDSLADAITFGLVPSMLIYYWGFAHTPYLTWGIVVAFVFLGCGVSRLARFNVLKEADAVPANVFIGLPIPSGAMAISALLLLLPGRQPGNGTEIALFSAYALLISYLMISTVHYRTVKKIVYRNSLPLLFLLILFVGLLIKFPDITIPVVTLVYMVSPVFFGLFRRLRRREEPSAASPPPSPPGDQPR